MIALHRASPPFARARLALLLLSPVLLIALVAVLSSVNALGELAPILGTTTDAGLARVGDDLALVIVTQRGADIAAARSLIFNWGILAPIAALLTAAPIAWWVAGRVRATVDGAATSIEVTAEEQASKVQDIVHELRTPLAVIGTNLELAGFESDPGGQSGRYIETARRAVGRMARTVDDLAGHGGLAVETGEDPVDLSWIAEALVDENTGPGLAKGVRVATAPMLPSVVARGVDSAAVRTAVSNFMTNAMRLAPRGSEITIDCGEHDGWAWIAVSDQGPGLAPQHHARVFERGWQGAHDRDRRDGSGLGLTIARQLTEAQGGLITVESEEGGGATFALWLPSKAGAVPDSIVASDRVHPAVRPWSVASSSIV